MKRLILTVLIIVLALTTWAQAGEILTASIDTGPFNCNDEMQDFIWINDTGKSIKIKSVTVWIGAQAGTKADILACVFTDTTMLLCVGWDRYANPTGLHQIDKSFGADWVTVPAGSVVRLQSFCHGFNGKTKKAHACTDIYYIIK